MERVVYAKKAAKIIKRKFVEVDVDDTETTSRQKRTSCSSTETDTGKSFDELISIQKPDHSKYLVKVEPKQRCDPSKLTENSLIYRPAKIVVLSNDGFIFKVRNQNLYKSGTESDWNLDANLISTQCWSAEQYTKVIKLTMTVLASKLKNEVGDCICQVDFFKLPDPKKMTEIIKEGSKLIHESDVSDVKKDQMFKKLYERTCVGEYRVLRGYIARSEDQEAQESETGMLKFIDAEAMARGENCIRLINLRNIQAVTFKLTRYELN